MEQWNRKLFLADLLFLNFSSSPPYLMCSMEGDFFPTKPRGAHPITTCKLNAWVNITPVLCSIRSSSFRLDASLSPLSQLLFINSTLEGWRRGEIKVAFYYIYHVTFIISVVKPFEWLSVLRIRYCGRSIFHHFYPNRWRVTADVPFVIFCQFLWFPNAHPATEGKTFEPQYKLMIDP